MRIYVEEALKVSRRALANGSVATVRLAFEDLAKIIETSPVPDIRRCVSDILEVSHLARRRGFSCESISPLQATVRSAQKYGAEGSGHLEVLMLALGVAQGACSDLDGAIQTLDAILRTPGVNAQVHRTALWQRGVLRVNRGEPELGIPCLREALHHAPQTGAPPAEIAQIELVLARALLEIGEFDEAEGMARRAGPILDTTDNPIDRALARDVVGKALQLRGRYGESLLYFEEALALLERYVGNRHPTYAVALVNLATICMSLGEFNRAEHLLNEAHATMSETLGADHPHIIPVLVNLMQVRSETADDAGVARLLSVLQEKQAGRPGHPLAVGLVWSRLGVIAMRQRRWDDAQAWFDGALLHLKDCPEQESVYGNIARLKGFQGKWMDEQAILEDLATTHQSRHTDSTDRHASVLLGLAQVALTNSQWSKALDCTDRAAQILARNLDEGHPDLAFCFELMSRSFLESVMNFGPS